MQMELSVEKVSKERKKELRSQYLTILTSRLVNNANINQSIDFLVFSDKTINRRPRLTTLEHTNSVGR